MSLREEWYAARAQRLEGIQLRQQQVLDHRQQTQMDMSATAKNRAEIAAALWESLDNFHSTLQTTTDKFLQDTRAYQRKVWTEQQNQRAAHVAAIRNYVWGTAPSA